MPAGSAVVELHVVSTEVTRAWCPRCLVSSGVRALVVGVNPATLVSWCRFTVHACCECGLALEQAKRAEPGR